MARAGPLSNHAVRLTHHALDRADQRLSPELRNALMDLRGAERLLRAFLEANRWYPLPDGGWLVIGSTHATKLGVIVRMQPGQVTVLTLIGWPRTPGGGVNAADVLARYG